MIEALTAIRTTAVTTEAGTGARKAVIGCSAACGLSLAFLSRNGGRCLSGWSGLLGSNNVGVLRHGASDRGAAVGAREGKE